MTPWTVDHQGPLCLGFPRQDTGVGSHSLLQGILPTQGLNLGLLHCRQILRHLNHKGSPKRLFIGKYKFDKHHRRESLCRSRKHHSSPIYRHCAGTRQTTGKTRGADNSKVTLNNPWHRKLTKTSKIFLEEKN